MAQRNFGKVVYCVCVSVCRCVCAINREGSIYARGSTVIKVHASEVLDYISMSMVMWRFTRKHVYYTYFATYVKAFSGY